MTELNLLTFNINDEIFALDLNYVREVIDKPEIMPVPDAPEFVLGVINLRGEILATIDMKLKLDLGATDISEDDMIIIAEFGNYSTGLLIKNFPTVVQSAEELLEEPTIIQPSIEIELIRGVVELEDDVIVLLNLEKLLEREG